MKKPNYSGVGYLKHTYDPSGLKKLMKRAVPKLQKFRASKPFDAIAFRGLSGASIAATLSWEMNIPMIAVRKQGSHDSRLAFGPDNVGSYIFVDDFICTGNTILQVVKRIEDTKYQWAADSPLAKGAKMVGIFCYASAPGYRRKKRLDRLLDKEGAVMSQILKIAPRYGAVPVMYL